MSVKKINGYRIFLQEKLGKGSYGTVHTVGYRSTVAKAMRPRTLLLSKFSINPIVPTNLSLVNSDPYLKAALISEIKIMKAVKSENIVDLIDVMESSNNYYIIQELCDGDLEHHLKAKPNHALDEKEAVQVLTEIAHGFLTLVKEGIVHRDLKPANIFMSKGSCKIGDFGFAKKN